MIDTLGQTQQTLLHLLHTQKSGMTVDQLAEALDVTRTAVRQHIAALKLSNFIQNGKSLSSGGRPSQFFQLTSKGNSLFPKQYSLFSSFLLDAVRLEKGDQGLSDWLAQIGTHVAQGLQHQVHDENLHGRLIKTVNVMNTLAYDAQLTEQPATYSIDAMNCVYHDLAEKYPQVCRFDLALLENFTESQVQHVKCIQKGDEVCRFCIKK